MKKLIGRAEEQSILRKAEQSDDAELISVVGRRRVGKTFLVRTFFNKKIEFEITGIQSGTLEEQFDNFKNRLNFHLKPTIPYSRPKSWMEAFQMLILHFDNVKFTDKVVLFFDEFPWMSTKRSGFLKAFGLFWNSWANQQNIIIVICGSAASWMIQKVVRDKGGLHNRITRRIHLYPFSLFETQQFLNSRSVKLAPYHIIQLYMITGGIPHYLKEIEPGKSATQNIDRICFSKTGLLKEEFNLLYPALFENPENHLKIVRLLANHRGGLTRKDIIEKLKLPNGGTTTKIIEDLEISGFITPFYSFGKSKKKNRFILTDEYSVFYLKFIENKRQEGKGTWEKLSQSQSYKSWSGFAFENICLKHIPQLKKALGISGVYTEASVYRTKGNDEMPGTQIDLILDRNDHVINLIEIKFYNTEFVLNNEYAEKLRRKMMIFQTMEKVKKQLFWTFITTFGILPNQHAISTISNDIEMSVFFEEV